MAAGSSTAWSSRLRLAAQPARLRLTLLYAGMFLLLGTAVIVVTFVLTSSGATLRASAAAAAPHQPGARLVQTVTDPAAGQHAADLGRLFVVSWLVLAVTAVASTVLGWFVAGRVLRPLRQMTTTAHTISAGNLSQRLALSGPDDEFKRLGDTFDALLGRLQTTFEAQRRFVANASHELRTPLTLHRTLLQVALADPSASTGSLRATCEELLASGREHERLLEALLTLASTERGLDERVPLDLAGLVERAVARSAAEIERGDVELVTALAPASVSGERALVERLIANLLDNAISYNVPGGQIEIATATEDGHARLSIANAGPPIAPDEVEPLFEPFHQLESRRAAGDGHHGLGLSIVKAIAVAHDGDVTAWPRTGGGLVVTVTFAAASPATV